MLRAHTHFTTRPTTTSRPARGRVALAAASVLALFAATGCSLAGGGGSDEEDTSSRSAPKQVVLVTHESFNISDELKKSFTEKTGFELKVNAAADAGALATKLAISADNPAGDVAFGIDNTYATRPLEAGAFADYRGARPTRSENYDLEGAADKLVPIDTAAVCVNVDTAWFAAQELDPPTSLDDLTKPAYRDLFVTPAPSTSSPGMAFLLVTVAAKGDAWPEYWKKLYANGAKSVKGWSDAYYSDFTAGGEGGKRPIVVSYDSSPAFTLSEDKKTSTTAALLDTCFNQVEYAGVLEGAKNPKGARAAVEFLASEEFQAALPESMYVFPVSQEATLPADWATFAKRPARAYVVPAEKIAENREAWVRTWTDIATN